MTAQISALDGKIDAIEAEQETKISKDGGVRFNYGLADDAEEKLDEIIEEVADFAASMTDEFPELDEKFRKPRGSSRRRKIAAARAFAADAVDYKAAFKGRGMDADFMEILGARADALEEALAAAGLETAERVGATGNLPLLVKDANKIIKSVDPIVRKKYRDNPAKLAAWVFASKVQRDAQPKPKPGNNPGA